MPVNERIQKLRKTNEEAELGGGKKRMAEQHQRGKLTARERLRYLLDPGTFQELDKFVTHRATEFKLDKNRPLGDGVVIGYGRINGRLVYIFSHDFTVFGGSLGEAFGKKVSKIMDLALKNGAPIIGLNDSGGARIQEGVVSLAAYSEIFYRNTLCSGVIPQISAILGPSAGGAVYSPAMTDFVFMVKGVSKMFVTGPDVVKAALGLEVTHDELGSSNIHASRTGVAHFVTVNEQECFTFIRELLSYLPQNNSQSPPMAKSMDPPERIDEFLSEIVPEDPYKPYDMRKIIRSVVDDSKYLEVHSDWAQNISVGFGHLGGTSVGIVANQPLHLSGAIDTYSSMKAARFIRTCDCFNMPIITLVDVPGYLPGPEEEHRGIIRHGSKLLYAYCEATVPKITTIIRKAYGGAYCAMGSKFSRADINYAWPTAEIAVMGPEGAISIMFRKKFEGARDKAALRTLLAKEYREKFANPYVAASRGIIDEIIEPAMTRPKLIAALSSLRDKSEFRPRKKHGNIQL